LLLIYFLLAALMTLLRSKDVRQAQLLFADGIIHTLSFKAAGTLLKTIELHTRSYETPSLI